jgi:hypothetical protein
MFLATLSSGFGGDFRASPLFAQEFRVNGINIKKMLILCRMLLIICLFQVVKPSSIQNKQKIFKKLDKIDVAKIQHN